MSKTSTGRSGLERYLHDREFEIRGSLKSIHSSNTFSVDGIVAAQLNRLEALQAARVDLASNALHLDWNRVDLRRASAACAFEQFRARAWALGELNKSLSSTYTDLYHLTFADTADRRRSGDLTRFNIDAFKRGIRRALNLLQKSFPDFWAVGMVEISAAPTSGQAVLFEPHCHLLVDGVPSMDLRAVFKSVLKKRSSALRPVQLEPVRTPADRARVLSYFFKQVPELRNQIVGEDGRLIEGRSNHLTGPAKVEWLAWMAAHHVTELLIGTGLPAVVIEKFEYRDLQLIIDELLKGGSQHGN
ncbi:hypothetical protein J2X76_002234 [Neorhizobium sp. 2083]|uniref:hypothetical protein n=1 Tax=Neorhizobium sp. 2083 TaxID=2817762 RepID=UPI000DE05AB4|nr:hypothetical protein [Neorhizobium sp. 2083]MDR6817061.1 hypothetical protein [Neorhizobium sp. 2083]